MNTSRYIFACVFLMFPNLTNAETKVTFIVPDVQGPIFWQLVAQTSIAAANDLNIDLDIIYSNNDRFALIEKINQIIAQENKPDYIVLRPLSGNTKSVFSLLEQSKIKFITIEQSIDREKYKSLAVPRQYYKYWLGHIYYDDVAGGKLLRDSLIRIFKEKYPDKEIIMTGIGGDHTELSINRQQSLVNLIKNEKIENVSFTQIFPVLWDPTLLSSRYPLIINRYPKTNIFWTAGDQIALTLIAEQKRLKHKISIVGGFDWLPSALESIQQGELSASVGGHFLMAAAVMIKIADYEKGIDRFLLESTPLSYELITLDNVNQYVSFIKENQWEDINFKLFSKFHSGDNTKRLSIENILPTGINKKQIPVKN